MKHNMKYGERKGRKRPQSTGKRTKRRQQRKDSLNYARQKLLERRNIPQEDDNGLAPNIVDIVPPSPPRPAELANENSGLANESLPPPPSTPSPPTELANEIPGPSSRGHLSPRSPRPTDLANQNPGPSSSSGNHYPRSPRRSIRTMELTNKKKEDKKRRFDAQQEIPERMLETQRQLQVITIVYCKL